MANYFSWQGCPTVYREHDAVEKTFRTLKRDIRMPTPQCEKRVFDEGIPVSNLHRPDPEDAAVEIDEGDGADRGLYGLGMLLELAKIKKIKLANGEIVVTGLSRRQRKILEKLGLCA